MDELIAQGWVMYKACNCGGTLTLKYKHDNHPAEIHTMPKRGTGKLIIGTQQIYYGPIQNIQTALKESEI
jgi:hypothetical protein